MSRSKAGGTRRVVCNEPAVKQPVIVVGRPKQDRVQPQPPARPLARARVVAAK